MAWSSLASNECPTKADVQEAINSGAFKVWRGSNKVGNTNGSNTTISHNNSIYKSALISLDAYADYVCPSTVYIEKDKTLRYKITSGSAPWYIFTVHMTSSSIIITKVTSSSMNDLVVRQIIYLQ